MKILYHGGVTRVDKPLIIPSNRTLDFGEGFYTTSGKEQAEQWVRIKRFGQKGNEGFLNIYHLEENLIEKLGLKVLHFLVANEKWVDFVMANRTNRGYTHDYDLVIGPVANDRIYTCFNAYENGFMNKTALIEELKSYKLVDQYLFHTHRSLVVLEFITAERMIV